jgi:hypothetical protein
VSQILRKIITTFAGVALVFGMSAPTSAARVWPGDSTGSGPFAAPAACSVTVGAETSVLDGEANLSGMGPGSVICLQAGTRGNVKVANLHGTPAAPITIRNEGGPVVITGTQFEAAIYVQASSNLRITGSGSEARCTASAP